MTTIPWANIRTQNVVDGLGRSFKWTDLKGKRIYICGHGAHIFRDGYCAVPAGTTVNFYQTYGQILAAGIAGPWWDIMTGKQEYERERSFGSGQSCPNMTLFDDDAHCIEITVDALKIRLGSNFSHMDHFMFNCNQFSDLNMYRPWPQLPVLEKSRPWPCGPRDKDGIPASWSEEMGKLLQPIPEAHEWSGKKQVLKLEEILAVLQGNTIEWMCCQDLAMERYEVGIAKPEKPQTNTDGLSERVKAGLRAMVGVSAEIARSHYVPQNPRLGASHIEGIWASIPNTRERISKEETKTLPNMGGTRSPHDALNRNARNRSENKSGVKVLVKVQDVREKAMASRGIINTALQALQDEPQGNPFRADQARAELRRGLLVVENFLRNLAGKKDAALV